ncbi:hypothetical protein [Acidovorax temperans]|uniref:hypothetical protein n=1 Tax=Acidovorax temperans TaxID=80878 RepID=UPI000B01B6A8|nr:hypothetical protein [Acidovorax temperans]
MSTRTTEPVHVVLPNADGGYYRFGELPRLITEALMPDTEGADADPQGSYYVIRALEEMNYEKDLPQAAALPPGEPGYLHVVENSASKRPLKWRTGAVLDAGLVHLDWLNEWGESRKPPHVFSTASAPEPQAEPGSARPTPVKDVSADDGEKWKQKARQRADEIIKRQRAKDLHPSQEAIADEIAREFRQACIVGAAGKPLTGAYIKRHALKGISSAQNRQLSTSVRRGK